MAIVFGLFSLAVLIGIAAIFSNNRRAIDWRLVATGLLLQIVFAFFVLLGDKLASALGGFAPILKTVALLAFVVSLALFIVDNFKRELGLERYAGYLFAGAAIAALPFLGDIFTVLAGKFVQVLDFVREGSNFVFGPLVDIPKTGFIFAFQVLPTIIFFAALMGVLYHLGIMQFIVRLMALGITKVMRVSGAETTSVCASVFIGQTEAPLTVRPYISKMTESELLTMMIGGMAHIAGGVMAAYVQMLGTTQQEQIEFAKHFLAASIMAAPATLLLAKVLRPEVGEPLTRGEVKMHVEKTSANVIEAAAGGAADGLKLALNIGAMLLAFISLIALLNALIGWVGGYFGYPSLDLQAILGRALSPVAFLIGVPWSDAQTVGGLIGQKIVINEFIAYQKLAEVSGQISAEAKIIATYALCGFANFSSIAIQIGGIGGLAPERRSDLARLGLLAVLGGCLATFMTATIAGVLIKFQ